MANNIKFGDVDIQIPSFEIKKFGGLIAVIIAAITLFFSIYTVGANENAVVLRFGKYSSTTMPGLQFKIPFIDKINTKNYLLRRFFFFFLLFFKIYRIYREGVIREAYYT